MVNISTNFVKTYNYLSPQIIEKKTTSYTDWNPDYSGLGQENKKSMKWANFQIHLSKLSIFCYLVNIGLGGVIGSVESIIGGDRDRRGRDHIVVGFTTTCAINAYHH